MNFKAFHETFLEKKNFWNIKKKIILSRGLVDGGVYNALLCGNNISMVTTTKPGKIALKAPKSLLAKSSNIGCVALGQP